MHGYGEFTWNDGSSYKGEYLHDANMGMAFLLLDLKNTIRVNGLTVNKMVEAFCFINKALYFKKVFGKMAFLLEKLIEFIIMIVFNLNETNK